MQKLISIITPTYNCGHLIHRLLNSVLNQTYNNIEMFVIDDGSTDNTRMIIDGYFKKFNDKGYAFHYVYQDNQGQSAALNSGLKLIKGDYLVWPDADDWYAEPNSLEILVTALDDADADVSCVRCLSYYVCEKTLDIVRKVEFNENQYLFEDCLFFTNDFFWGAGNYIIKVQLLFNEITERSIPFEEDAGQNPQILLPILFGYKCITINKYLHNILRRSDSHCRKKLNYEDNKNRHKAYLNILIATLNNIKSISEKEKKYLIRKIKRNVSIMLFKTSYYFGKTEEVKDIYEQMVVENMAISKKIKIIYYMAFIPCGFAMLKIFQCMYKKIVIYLLKNSK